MAKEKVTSEEKIDKQVQKAVKKAMDKVNTDSLADGFDPDEGELLENLGASEAEQDAALEEAIGFDLFDFIDDRQKAKKDLIRYTIWKNGELLTTKFHPYSWAQMQKDYGAGSYQVKAASTITKKFVKSQTQSIAGIDEKPSMQFRFGEREENPAPQQPVQPPQPNFIEMMNLMNGINDKSKSEAREMAKEQATNSTGMMQVFASMMQTMSQNSQTMFLEMSKQNMAVAEKMQDTTNRLMEKMDMRFEKIVEKMGESKKKDEGVSPLELLKLAEDSQKKGFDMFHKMSTLAEEKASERMEMMDDRQSERSSKPEKTTLVERVLENFLPVVSKAMEAQGQPQQPAYHPAPAPRRVLPPNSQIQRTAPLQPQAPRPQPRTEPNQTQPTNVAAEAPVEIKSAEDWGTNGSGDQQVQIVENKQGIPSVQFPDKQTAPQVLTKEIIEEFLVPTIGAALLVLDTPEKGKDRIIKVLQEKNIPIQLFISTFTKEDAAQIVGKYNLPQEAVAWFEEIYANIERSA